jgi:anaerobic ribonucleoside-triphosphate reductase activating protein
MKIQVHAVEPASRANGPGLRAVVWFQGCTLNCPGCFNPTTHDPLGGIESDTEILAAEILSLADTIEGVSVSGGEPFQQPEALLNLLERLAGTSQSRLVFSGYTLAQLAALPFGPAVLRHVDVLIAGRYIASRRTGHGLVGSANQQIHLLTNRYTLADLAAVPPRELVLHRDGTVSVSGISPWTDGFFCRR